MKLLICSIFDDAVKAYQMPFYSRSKGEASRSFADAVNDEKSPFAKHPGDFTLFAIGTFDDETGKIEQSAMHSKIISAVECAGLSDDYYTAETQSARRAM